MASQKPRPALEFAAGDKGSSEWIVQKLSPLKPFVSTVPFLFLGIESLLAFVARSLYSDSDWMSKMMLCQLLAVNCTFTGLLHFYPPLKPFYTSMIFLPFKEFWLYLSGLALLSGGILVAFSRTQTVGAWVLIVTFIGIFPGNVACVFLPAPRKMVCGNSIVGATVRLPFQFLFIYWAHWFTTPTPTPAFSLKWWTLPTLHGHSTKALCRRIDILRAIRCDGDGLHPQYVFVQCVCILSGPSVVWVIFVRNVKLKLAGQGVFETPNNIVHRWLSRQSDE